MNFSDIVGQSVLVDRLKRITQSQRIGHAYLFVGPEGIGKKTVSRDIVWLLVQITRS